MRPGVCHQVSGQPCSDDVTLQGRRNFTPVALLGTASDMAWHDVLPGCSIFCKIISASLEAQAVCIHSQILARPHPYSGCIGEGSYARVYQGVDGDCADVALKHERPPCPWEW